MSTRALLGAVGPLRASPYLSTPCLCRSAPLRAFSTTRFLLEPKKPSIKAIGELRKLVPGTSMIKAREALYASRSPSAPDQDDLPAALQWLEEDRKKSGAKKAEKVAGRSVREGVVAVSVLADGLPTPLEASTKSQLNHQAVQAGIGATPAAQGALVEVNCETDFVARNEVFVQLVRDVAHTAALFPSLSASHPDADGNTIRPSLVEIPVAELLAFPLLPSSPEAAANAGAPKTVGAAIIDTVSRLGEKISIARASAIRGAAIPPASAPRRSSQGTAEGSAILHLASAFAHGGASASTVAAKAPATPGYVLTTGRVASLLLTKIADPALPDLLAKSGAAVPPTIQDSARALVRSLARQTAGMNTTSIRESPSPDAVAEQGREGEPSEALYAQPFLMLLPGAAPTAESNAQPVEQVLGDWAASRGLQGREAVEVVEMRRWEMGETAEPVEEKGEGFADEVRRAAGLA